MLRYGGLSETDGAPQHRRVGDDAREQ
jgi:hypothetical protein